MHIYKTIEAKYQLPQTKELDIFQEIKDYVISQNKEYIDREGAQTSDSHFLHINKIGQTYKIIDSYIIIGQKNSKILAEFKTEGGLELVMNNIGQSAFKTEDIHNIGKKYQIDSGE